MKNEIQCKDEELTQKNEELNSILKHAILINRKLIQKDEELEQQNEELYRTQFQLKRLTDVMTEVVRESDERGYKRRIYK